MLMNNRLVQSKRRDDQQFSSAARAGAMSCRGTSMFVLKTLGEAGERRKLDGTPSIRAVDSELIQSANVRGHTLADSSRAETEGY